MDTSVITHLVAGLIGAIAGYTVRVNVSSKKRVQKGNTVGGHMSGGDMDIKNRD